MAIAKKLATLAALLFGLVGLAAITGFNQKLATTQLFSQIESLDDQEVMNAYVNFVAEYGRMYTSHSKHSQKYEVFKANYRKIRDNNKRGGDVPFVMSVNQFTDMSNEEFQKLLGVTIPKVLMQQTEGVFVMSTGSSTHSSEKTHKHHHHHHHNRTSSHEKNGMLEQQPTVADSINWNEKGVVSKPYDQGSCGSCWAFTTAATLESLSVISGKFKEPPSYSMQQLLDCDKSNDGCSGGWMYKAYAYTAEHGIMDYKDYPYRVKADHEKCLYQKDKAVFKNVGMKQEKLLSNDELKKVLMTQPVGVGIFTNSNFQFYKKGVMTEETLKCSDLENKVNHGVTVIGFGKTTDVEEKKYCEQYWIVRNSWGTKWGEEGFFRLCMDGTGSNEQPYGICQLNRFPTYPTMKADPVDTDILFSE